MKKAVSGLMMILTVSALLSSETAFAAHPLITDDTGTQGKGKFQIEVTGEYGIDKETVEGVAVEETASEAGLTFSWGVSENADVVIGIPYLDYTVKEDGASIASESGMSDVSLEYKHRFFEQDGLSMAVKPGVSLPTGDENKGLSNGKASYGAFFISTKEMEPWAFHFNLGYLRSEYKLKADEEANRKDIWHVSLASQVEVVKDLNVVANIGMETNSDKTSDTNPAFILGGIIYSISEDFDIDLGIKTGLNKPETDIAYLAGMAVRF